MESASEILQETPDLDFSENPMEQETPDIDFSDVNAIETPDIDFSENAVETVNTSHERERIFNDENDIDDLDEPDQYVDEEDNTENANQNTIQNNNSESAISSKSKVESKTKDSSEHRLVQLPTARIKHIMKADPDVSLITGECTFLVTKATELFIESLAREAFLHTAQAKKKTVQKRDVDAAIDNVESLMFLEGMMNF